MIFIDFDGTLINNLSQFLFIKEAIKARMFRLYHLPALLFIALLYKLKLIGDISAMRQIYKRINFGSLRNFQNLCLLVFRKYIQGQYNTAVLEHSFNDIYSRYIISTGLSGIIQHAVSELKLDGHVSSHLRVSDEGNVSIEDSFFLSGEDKLSAVKRLVCQHEADPVDCYFYSDSINDLGCLEYVGNPVVVNPDRKLKKIAQMRNWKFI